MGNISLEQAFVTGRKRVPKPAAGITTLVICFMVVPLLKIFKSQNYVYPPDTYATSDNRTLYKII